MLAQASSNNSYNVKNTNKSKIRRHHNFNEPNEFSDPSNPDNPKQLLSLTRFSWDVHLAVCRCNAGGNFGWVLIVLGSLLLSFRRNTTTVLPFQD
jgi:hypothetical protein